MKNRRTLSLAPLFLIGVGLFGTACTLDKKKLEDSITDECKKKEIPLKSVSCPEGVKIKQDDKFDCTGETQDGDKVTFHVTQTDSQGSIKWELDGQILDEAAVGDSLVKGIDDKLHVKADVKCPKKTIVLAQGKSFTCDVTVDGDTKKVEITLGKDGSYSWEVK